MFFKSIITLFFITFGRLFIFLIFIIFFDFLLINSIQSNEIKLLPLRGNDKFSFYS